MRRLLVSVSLAALGSLGCSESAPQAIDDAGNDTAPLDDTAIDTATTDTATTDTAIGEAGSDAADAAFDADAGACGCVDYSDPVSVGLMPLSLKETSGLAASRKNPGVIYAHNDSGDSARIFAIGAAGTQLGQIDLGGATAVDWEDIAVGPCGGGSCVFVADVGDNGKSRSDYAIYAIDEPTLDGKTFATKTLAARKFPFSYPDGKWNCETLLADPKTGRLYVVTKDDGIDAGVYAFPETLTPGAPVTLTKVATATGTKGNLVTGGDVSPCGDRVLLRTYGSLLEYTVPTGKALADAFAAAPRKVPVAKESQGEAVAFRADGRGYFTASEGTLVSLFATGCR